MTKRMRRLRRELALNCPPDAHSERALYWVPLTDAGRIAVRIKLALVEREERNQLIGGQQ